MTEQKVLKAYDKDQLEKLLENLELQYGSLEYDSLKHQLSFPDKQSLSIRLPFSFNYLNEKVVHSNFLIILIHSGEASLAYSEEDQIAEHKMVKAYMVRQKQGKSQIKHLKTKGKSKAGSRVRLAGTDHFFEEINEKITEWDEYHEIEKIAISCNKTLQPYFFNRPDAALLKNDSRLFKIPKHIQEANYDNLTSIHNYLISTEFKFDDSYKEFITKLISEIDNE
ncbi:hypothetical protein SAMN05661096_02431 [Marivirga sericea]|uniref:VLRF1 domain-containing protein n=1 Tax=Marivirga sericea TaxID=1028 RepID=A0A1X7K8W3_9BACT|nr:hypothetical protein [Marivirga sericea]SMG37235.1 hypothetical protein SAMN05661096_02431 [Marivirga sericea]